MDDDVPVVEAHEDPEVVPPPEGPSPRQMGTWRLARSLERLRGQINAMAPNRSKRSDGSIGDAAHSSRTSDHNPDRGGVVRAIDVTHDPAGGMNASDVTESIRASRDTRVKYVIWSARMFSSYSTGSRQAWAWGPYTGSNLHRAHMHVSILGTAAAESDTSLWDISGEQTLRPGMTGLWVTKMQHLLGVDGDGVYGPATEAALRAFQAKCGLVADGICGPLTWAALNNPPIVPATPPSILPPTTPARSTSWEDDNMITYRDVQFRRRPDGVAATRVGALGVGGTVVGVSPRTSFAGPHPTVNANYLQCWENNDSTRGRLVALVPGGGDFNADVHVAR